MKYLLFILVIVFASCQPPKRDDNGKEASYGVQVITVNGCQYVLYLTSYSTNAGAAIVHAGNCNNPIHKTNKQP